MQKSILKVVLIAKLTVYPAVNVETLVDGFNVGCFPRYGPTVSRPLIAWFLLGLE